MILAPCRPVLDRQAPPFHMSVAGHLNALSERAPRLTWHQASAEDLLQETLLRPWPSFHTFALAWEEDLREHGMGLGGFMTSSWNGNGDTRARWACVQPGPGRGIRRPPPPLERALAGIRDRQMRK